MTPKENEKDFERPSELSGSQVRFMIELLDDKKNRKYSNFKEVWLTKFDFECISIAEAFWLISQSRNIAISETIKAKDEEIAKLKDENELLKLYKSDWIDKELTNKQMKDYIKSKKEILKDKRWYKTEIKKLYETYKSVANRYFELLRKFNKLQQENKSLNKARHCYEKEVIKLKDEIKKLSRTKKRLNNKWFYF